MGGLSPQPPGERNVHENAFPQWAESHSVELGFEKLLVPCLGSSLNKAMDQPPCVITASQMRTRGSEIREGESPSQSHTADQ